MKSVETIRDFWTLESLNPVVFYPHDFVDFSRIILLSLYFISSHLRITHLILCSFEGGIFNMKSNDVAVTSSLHFGAINGVPISPLFDFLVILHACCRHNLLNNRCCGLSLQWILTIAEVTLLLEAQT
ncbi:hypothetical protein Dimus_031746 [Dionaea muscipula]